MPAPVLLTDSELEDLCNYLSTLTYIYYPVATDFFHDMYKTGCRPAELLDITRWTYISSTNIILIPLKGNSPRTFLESELSGSLVFCIINQIEPYQSLSLRQLKSVLKKILPVAEISTIDKSAIDYMFRYNKVKQLAAVGMSDSDIAILFGWSAPSLALGYRSQSLYSSTPLPPVLPNRIIDDIGDYLIDFDGSIISFP